MAKCAPYPWWIKQRRNPQLGVYYVGMGQMSKTAAMKWEKGILYGSNMMLRFETETEYLKKLKELKSEGKDVQ